MVTGLGVCLVPQIMALVKMIQCGDVLLSNGMDPLWNTDAGRRRYGRIGAVRGVTI
jgi:hypothetical protein